MNHKFYLYQCGKPRELVALLPSAHLLCLLYSGFHLKVIEYRGKKSVC